MRVITDRDSGLFPAPSEIEKSCSCPDWAGLCKHLAAALYGIGARLDEKPELLFLLRGVDHTELLEGAPAATGTAGPSTLDSADLADVFGIEIAAPDAPKKSIKQKAKPKTSRPAKPVKKPPAKKAATKRPSSTMPKKPVKKVVLPDKLKAARGRRAKRKTQAFQIRAQGKK